MNVKSLLLFFVGVISGILLLSSCSDEEEVWDPREHTGWGCFAGTVNGEKVSLENDVHNSYLNYTPQREELDPNVVKGVSIVINLNNAEQIGISLYRFSEGMRFVTSGINRDYNSDGVQFRRTELKEDGYSYDIYYAPEKGKPFKMEITDLTYYDISSRFVRVCARLDGVLYRVNNPQQDSVVIKGYFEVR